MLSKAALDFILHVTNYFHGHWEDPEWGKMPINQVLISLVIRELAQGVQDTTLRTQMTAAANESITKSSQAIAKAAVHG